MEDKNLDRMCCTDECYRNDVIFALEAELNIEVLPEMKWGHFQTFCVHEDKMYYYKPELLRFIKETAEETALPQEILDFIPENPNEDLGQEAFHRLISMMKSNTVTGMPKYLDQTDSFIITENVMITEFDTLSEGAIEKIEATFTSDINPLLGDLINGVLYIGNDGNLYCTHTLSFISNPNAMFGAMINGKYEPFRELNADEQLFADTMGLMAID
jgi:hypothetical protein